MCLVEQQTNLDSVRVTPVTLGDVTCYKLSTSSSRPQHHELGGSTTWYLQAHTRRGKARRDCVKPSKRGEIDISPTNFLVPTSSAACQACFGVSTRWCQRPKHINSSSEWSGWGRTRKSCYVMVKCGIFTGCDFEFLVGGSHGCEGCHVMLHNLCMPKALNIKDKHAKCKCGISMCR